MRVLLLGLVGVLGSALCACAPGKSHTRPTAILPLKTLRLYETGVGYFERAGQVQASGDMSLPIPSAHLDDALKTLVVLGDKGTTRVDGVQFGSSVSRAMARAMAGLPQDADAPIEYRDLLVSLKGAGVEVVTGKQRLRGRLIDVLGKAPSLTIVLLLDTTDLVQLEAKNIVTIRATDPAYANRLGAGLDALSTRGAQSQRLMRVLASSNGPVTLGYIAEAPIWRTTYRLVMDDKGAPLLQGWALLHNDTDETWDKVAIELVNGRPDSFLFPLAAPRYARRPLAHPEAQLSTVPQLVDQTADIMWGDHVDEAYGHGGLGLSGIGAGGGGTGEGTIGLGSIGTIGHGRGSAGTSALLTVDGVADTTEAKGVEAGALFSYRLAEPLELRAHSSALVPFLQRPITADQIVWFDGFDANARSAVRVVNTTQQTLPTGTLALFARGGFAGETALDRLKPNEKRFIEYGTDLDVELHHRRLRDSQNTKRLTYDGRQQQLTEHYLQTTEEELEIENRSGQSRTVWIKLPYVSRAQVTGPDAQELDTNRAALVASLASPPREKRVQKLVAIEPLTRHYAVSELSVKWTETAMANASLEASDRAVLQEALPKQRLLEQNVINLAAAKKELAGIDTDLTRLREHVKAITAEKASAAPLVTRILAAEDRRTATLHRIEALEAEHGARQTAIRDVMTKLARTP